MGALFDNVTPFPVKQKDNDWFTPARYIEAARKVMGSIELDPASCELANKTVQATRYYTKEDNALIQDWRADTIWLNPPYGKVNPVPGSTKSYQKLFVERLLWEYDHGNVKQATLLLLGNSCFAHYFYPLWKYPLCFHDGYISFYRPDGSTSDFGFGTIIVYMGPREDRFVDIFSQFGTVAKRVSPVRERPMPVRTLWDMEAQP